jgi:3-hydroxy-9,10-secoandrosta-1,3,5(10)-triene-9,17-dione monooxygenase reductase component
MADPAPGSTSFDAARYRHVLGHFPTGVAVVTGMAGQRPVGFAVGSFTSLSLEPPQVLLCPGRQSSSWPTIEASGRFCVNVLADDQQDVSRLFATKAPDKFSGLAWRPSRNGSPLIDGALASVDCDIASVTPAGDHYVVIGAVTHLDAHRPGGPLVFFRGAYCSASA